MLDAVLVAVNLVELLTQARQRHAEVFLYLFLAAQVGDKEVDAVLDLGADGRSLHLNGVDASLVQEQFVNRHLLGNNAIRVTFNRHTLIECLLILFLDIALVDGLVADDPSHLLGHVVLGQEGERCHGKQHCGK